MDSESHFGPNSNMNGLTDRPLVNFVGPADGVWNWIRANLALCQPSVPLSPQLPDPQQSETASKPGLDLSRSQQLKNYLKTGPTKTLLAVEGRLDTAVSDYLSLKAAWDMLLNESMKGEAEPNGPAIKKRRKSSTKSNAEVVTEFASAKDAADGHQKTYSVDFLDHFGLVLSDSWPGHRRTRPFPEGCIPFYWYELFDRIIPWAASISGLLANGRGIDDNAVHSSSNSFPTWTPWANLNAETARRPAGSNGRTNARVDRFTRLARMHTLRANRNTSLASSHVLVMADTQTGHALWKELLAPQGVRPVITNVDQLNFYFHPNIVIIDVPSLPRRRLGMTSCERGLETDGMPAPGPLDYVDPYLCRNVQTARDRFPEALIVVLDSFPRWETWNFYLSLGTDLLIPRPFDWYGLLWCFEHWLGSSNQVRINSGLRTTG